MFLIRRPSDAEVETFLARQASATFSYPDIGATGVTPPEAYVLDRNRVRLGIGRSTFDQAVASLRAWRMLNLGWMELRPSSAPIEVGSTVAILVKHFGFWSLNACRIVYVIQEERRFAFAYGTLPDHAAKGEEQFSVEWLPDDQAVVYSILAFSKPAKWLARLGRPFSRRLQKKFARDSMAAMKK